MTQDEIIEMARQAKILQPEAVLTYLESFAKLVAQHEREACIVDIQMCIPRSGHDTPEMFFAKKVMERIRTRGDHD